MNVEFQNIARRDKKAFLSNKCKEIEENNRMGKTRVLFTKSRDIKGNISWNSSLLENGRCDPISAQKPCENSPAFLPGEAIEDPHDL